MMSKKKWCFFSLAHLTTFIWFVYAAFINPHPKLFNSSEFKDVLVLFESTGPWLFVFFLDIIFDGPIEAELRKERTENLDKVED